MDIASLELVNSEVWYGLGPLEDQLASDPIWLKRFLARWDLPAPVRQTRHELDELIRLRSLLRRLIDTLAAHRALRDADVKELNQFLAAQPVVRTLAANAAGYGLTYRPVHADLTWALAEITASFVNLLSPGKLERIKTCENPQCRWAFYDETKNRRRRWCDPAVCGNRDKVRRFRARAPTAD